MADPTSKLVAQLNTMLRLTQTEAMIAHSRRAQAGTPDVERELAANARKAQERSRLIGDAIRELGGVPNVVGAAVGRLAATAKTQFEQGQTLTEALLSDLALEHQLRDRARLARMLADTAGMAKFVRLAERLEKAHGETIDWINARLAEVAVGGPAAIRPTPVQSAVGVARRAATFPARSAAVALNRTLGAVGRLQQRAEETVETNVEKATALRDAAGDIFTAGRDAALERTEEVARDEGEDGTAAGVRRTRRNLGALSAEDLPIRNYDDLNADVAISRIAKLREAADVQAILAYEAANKNRKGVSAAAQDRLAAVAADLAGVS